MADPNGDPDPDGELRVGVGIGFSGGSLATGIRLSVDLLASTKACRLDGEVSVRAHAFASFGLYDRFQTWDVSAGYIGQLGFGPSDYARPITTVNQYQTFSSADRIEHSLSYGQAYMYDRGTDEKTRQGIFGLGIGNVGVWYHNDATSFPSFAGTGAGTDQGWTGGLTTSYTVKKGETYSYSYESYTGIPLRRGEQTEGVYGIKNNLPIGLTPK